MGLSLPSVINIPFLPLEGAFTLSLAPLPAPTPLLWTLEFQPGHWMYTDGSNIKGQPRLGAAVIHVPTYTIIYIGAGGTEETRTIMRGNGGHIYGPR